jgi:hypothetical protein
MILWTVFGSEVLSTGVLILLGVGIGSAINPAVHPARDLGPVPVVGPLSGAVLAGGLSHVSF